MIPPYISELTKSQHTDDVNERLQIFKKILHTKFGKSKEVDLSVQKLLNDMTLDWYSLMNSSLYTRQTWDDKFIHFQSCTFVFLRT